MQKVLKNIIVLILLAFFVLQQSELKAQSDANIKAQWIYNILPTHVSWKNEETVDNYTVGVYGSGTQVYNELVQFSKTKKIKGKSFSVVRFRRTKDISYTHILFVESSSNEYIQDIYENMLYNTLLITDQCPDKDYYMLNLLPLHEGKKRFELNSKVARSAGLEIGRALLKFGGSDVELRGMINKTEKELEKERKKLERQRAELAVQTEELGKLKRENRLERKKNDQQKEINKRQKIEIDNQKLELENQREELFLVQKDLNVQREKLSIHLYHCVLYLMIHKLRFVYLSYSG